MLSIPAGRWYVPSSNITRGGTSCSPGARSHVYQGRKSLVGGGALSPFAGTAPFLDLNFTFVPRPAAGYNRNLYNAISKGRVLQHMTVSCSDHWWNRRGAGQPKIEGEKQRLLPLGREVIVSSRRFIHKNATHRCRPTDCNLQMLRPTWRKNCSGKKGVYTISWQVSIWGWPLTALQLVCRADCDKRDLDTAVPKGSLFSQCPVWVSTEKVHTISLMYSKGNLDVHFIGVVVPVRAGSPNMNNQTENMDGHFSKRKTDRPTGTHRLIWRTFSSFWRTGGPQSATL